MPTDLETPDVTVSVVLPEDLKAWFVAEAARLDRSFSYVARIALVQYRDAITRERAVNDLLSQLSAGKASS